MDMNDEKTCPYCGETIKKVAIKCKHCKSDLNDSVKNITSSKRETHKTIEVIHHKTEKSGDSHAFERFIGFLLIVFGILISFTGLGAIIGVPMIIAGAICMFFPMFALVLVLGFIVYYKFKNGW